MKNNKKLIIAVISLIVVLIAAIGATYAYFTANVSVTNEGEKETSGTATTLVSSTMALGDKITATNALPGYKALKTLSIVGSGPDGAKSINTRITITPDVTDFSSHVIYSLYEVETSEIGTKNVTCTESNPQTSNNLYYDSMTCDTSSVGEAVLSGTFEGTTPVTYDVEVNTTTNKTYYLLVEYINDEENDQNGEQGKTFTVTISYDETAEEVIKETLASYITTLAEEDTTNLVYDDTVDNNLRYIGANPNNYICFDENCTAGKWRIIGVMNNMTVDGSDKQQSLIKVIRADSIGSNKWDDSDVNDWSSASLQTSLNSGDLYNSYISIIYSKFATVVWGLGGTTSFSSRSDGLASHWYTYERGTSVYSGRPTTWIGKIGLMYPSDYGYATSGGSSSGRSTCLGYSLSSWISYSQCYSNDYLYNSSSYQWTLSPYSTSTSYVFAVRGTGRVDWYNSSDSYAVSPVGYLLSTTGVPSSGNGSSSNPYIIG